jgi:hypothetical protein
MRTNTTFKTWIAALLFTGAMACSDPAKEEFTPAQSQQKLILAALESDTTLSKFTEAFRAIDLASSAATGFTILAVKDTALHVSLTEEIFKRHILETAYAPSALSEAGKVTTLGGGELVVKTTEGVVALNNTIVGTHVNVGNSVMYVLEKLIPESNTFLGLNTDFNVTTSKVLRLRPEAIALEDASFEWSVEFEGTKSVASQELNYNFITLATGIYKLALKATLPGGKELNVAATVTVVEPETEYSPHPNHIIDLAAAPGQSLSKLGKTKDEALNYAYDQLKAGSGNVYMGAFGAYMVVGFDHTIMNRPGYCDFTTRYGGGNVSPSIVWVAYDANDNGAPDDDEWYEIKGSAHGGPNDLGIVSYTYSTTKTVKTDTEPAGYPWTKSDGTTGAVIDSHQNGGASGRIIITVGIVPWIEGDAFTLSGRELKVEIDYSNSLLSAYLPALPFSWGYAGNQPNGSKKAAIDIDWAVDANGNSVHLPGVDFIKVVNAIQGMRPMMGEYRFQVSAISALHVQSIEITTEEAQAE